MTLVFDGGPLDGTTHTWDPLEHEAGPCGSWGGHWYPKVEGFELRYDRAPKADQPPEDGRLLMRPNAAWCEQLARNLYIAERIGLARFEEIIDWAIAAERTEAVDWLIADVVLAGLDDDCG